jgi:phage shock protein PspC (stress-responsive transcriptional regulator)
MYSQIKRSKTNKMIGGVAGGIAEAFNWDPTLVRLGFVLLTLAHGGGILIYLVLMLCLPKADAMSLSEVPGVETGSYTTPRTDGNRMLGYLLMGLGGVLLLSVMHIPTPVLALAIIGAGWYFLRKRV